MAKSTPGAPKPRLAYEVHDGDDGWCIEFATSGAAARRQGANELNTDFSGIERCRRVPVLDQYAPGPVPPMALIEIGWHFECFCCSRKVNEDLHTSVEEEGLDPADFEIIPDGPNVYCSQTCMMSMYAHRRANRAAHAALIELFETKFPGATVTRTHVYGTRLEETPERSGILCSVTFTFPGCKYGATWVFGQEGALVSQIDVDAFKAYFCGGSRAGSAEQAASPEAATA